MKVFEVAFGKPRIGHPQSCFLILVAHLVRFPHRIEQAVRVLVVVNQVLRRIVFGQFASCQHQDTVVINDGVQAMGNGEHRAGLELAANRGLHQSVGVVVHRRGGFVQEQNPRRAQQGPGQAQELALAHAEVAAVFFDFCLKAQGQRVEVSSQMSAAESRPYRGVVVLAKRVYVEAHSAGKEHLMTTAEELRTRLFKISERRFDSIKAQRYDLIIQEKKIAGT